MDELGRWPASGAVGLHARNAARRLLDEGVTPDGLPAARAPSRGHVTNVDGAGCRGLVLLIPGPTSRTPADAFVALLSDTLGLKDAWAAWSTGKEAERAYSKPPRPSVTAPCDQAFTRALVGDALARHEATDRPVPGRFLLCRQLLGPEPLRVRVHPPDLSAYDAFAPDEALVAGSGFLADDTPFAGLACSSDAAYEVVRRSRTRGGRVAPALITRLLESVEAEERDRLLARLAANLEVLALRGEANRPLARTAHAVHLALAERRVAWSEVPYLRALAALTIPAIRANLSLGFRSQADANAAGLLMGLRDGGGSRAR